MSAADDLQSLIARIQSGTCTADDLDALREAVRAGRLTLATGERSVALGGDANGVVIVTGHHNVILSGPWAANLLAAVQEKAKPAGDSTPYLETLRDQTSHIDIRGLLVGSGKAAQLGIDELYIPLRTTLPQTSEADRQSDKHVLAELDRRGSTPVELHEALKHRVVLIVGDPGSGKTTFLRRIAYLLCESLLGTRPDAAKEQLGLVDRQFPILIRLADLVQHIIEARTRHAGPTSLESPRWLAHYLAAQSEDGKTGLSERYFEHQLEQGSALVLLDGLDEAPTQEERLRMVDLFEGAARAYKSCRFVLTSRPVAFRDDLVAPHCEQVRIDALEDEAINTFLGRWCQALFATSPGEAEVHCRELTTALHARPEIRRMARTPVMLTGLAVVHWNEKRLPEQRADLYESILMWLARSRQQRPGRFSPEKCINVHQELALAMQDHPEGRQVQISRREAAEAIAPQWRHLPELERLPAAEAFLVQEELDSGIVVSRGNQVRFWHLTFQEYLAARALAARKEEEQCDRLLGNEKLYQAGWRESVLLLAGVLHRQGTPGVDAMFSAILDQLGEDALLSDQARCCGLLGAAVWDLAPVDYRLADPRYEKLRDEVLGIFDREASRSVDIRVAIEAAEALGQAGDPRFAEDQRDENWAEIPAGVFLMGAQKTNSSGPNFDKEVCDDEGPVHEVYLDAYWIGKYPVTVAEYQRFVDAGGYQEEQRWQAGGFGKSQEPAGWEGQQEHPNRPVVGVSWYEASAYAAWAGGRLPTEAEWERAARGTDGNKHPWGNEEPDPTLLNYGGNVKHPTPVGIYPRGAGPEGVLDMAGNVWEWCQDWWSDNYSEADARNPTGPREGDRRVLRGGCWRALAFLCRSAFRHWGHPGRLDDLIGFRLVSGIAAARTLQ